MVRHARTHTHAYNLRSIQLGGAAVVVVARVVAAAVACVAAAAALFVCPKLVIMQNMLHYL